MPYIKREDRYRLALTVGQMPKNVGELTYLFAVLINEYLKLKGLKYQTIAEILGALEGVKADFNHQFTWPYEDTKATMNGDVYDKSVWDEINKEFDKWSEEHP